MTDQELLEKAAKAAGITGYRYNPAMNCMAHWNESDGGWFDVSCLWDPLANDGDALRLLGALRLCLCHTSSSPHGTAMVGRTPWGNRSTPIATERYLSDGQGAATRRAIVRAAAECAV